MTRTTAGTDTDRRRRAVVTGVSSGMGRTTAAALVAEGWEVLGLDRATAPADAPLSPLLTTVRVDITDRDAVRRALEDSLPPGAEVDLVANVAGIYPPSTLETFTEEQYRRTFDVNVLGTLNVIAEARPHLVDGSVIVNFASVDAFAVSPGQLLYGASKAAIVMLTKELALELAPAGIRVNTIAPGWVDTPGNAASGRMARAAADIPLGRVGQPSEIADWVLLLSRHSGFLTGETVVLSGGDVMR